MLVPPPSDAGLVHLVGAEFRWATGQRLAARAIAEGVIGHPRLATFLLHIPLLADPGAEVPSWWSDAAQGGGWLGAHATHLIDQVRTTLGEFDSVSAGLVQVADRGWNVEDAYTLHFRLATGVDGVLQSSAASWGPMLVHSRIAGTDGTLLIAGDTVHVADRSGDRVLDVPADMVAATAVPPPSDLLVTAYDLLHATGIDLAPYTGLAAAFRARILGLETAAEPPVPTFADGLAAMAVLDAARRSAAGSGWESVDSTAPRLSVVRSRSATCGPRGRRRSRRERAPPAGALSRRACIRSFIAASTTGGISSSGDWSSRDSSSSGGSARHRR
jgi:predicted dehydrogenase